MAEAALDAFYRCAKARGHLAQFNMDHYFAYAVAKTYRATLLFRGNDFNKTDIQSEAEARGLCLLGAG